MAAYWQEASAEPAFGDVCGPCCRRLGCLSYVGCTEEGVHFLAGAEQVSLGACEGPANWRQTGCAWRYVSAWTPRLLQLGCQAAAACVCMCNPAAMRAEVHGPGLAWKAWLAQWKAPAGAGACIRQLRVCSNGLKWPTVLQVSTARARCEWPAAPALARDGRASETDINWIVSRSGPVCVHTDSRACSEVCIAGGCSWVCHCCESGA